MTEILIDANALIRYLLNDVPEQADQVEALLDEAEAGTVRLVVHSHIIAELVWVLSSFYKVSKAKVRQQIEAVIQTPGLFVDEYGLILSALRDFEEKNVDYIDAYSAAWMKARSIQEIASFDKHFKRFEGVTMRFLKDKD